eukprot:scaffold9206_cov113-Isochrysis_galbana.AAC.2
MLVGRMGILEGLHNGENNPLSFYTEKPLCFGEYRCLYPLPPHCKLASLLIERRAAGGHAGAGGLLGVCTAGEGCGL